MRADDYGAFLVGRIGKDSIGSYRSYAAGVEAKLGVDLDRLDLSVDGIVRLKKQLIEVGVALKTASNYGSALKQYAAMLEAEHRAGIRPAR